MVLGPGRLSRSPWVDLEAPLKRASRRSSTLSPMIPFGNWASRLDSTSDYIVEPGIRSGVPQVLLPISKNGQHDDEYRDFGA